MKKNLVYAMMSAIALTSAVSFTGCASDDSASVDTNPTYDGNSVRTDFAFNITKASQGTRMTDANVQETGSFSFRGMSDMFLLSFHGEPGTSVEATANYPLGDLNNTVDITSTKSSKVYSLSIPVGTDNFLFYGKATRSGKTNYQVGRVSSSFYDVNGARTTAETSPLATADKKKAEDIKKISDIQFSLTPVQTSLGTDATNIAAYLTSIANTTGWAGTVTLSATDARYSSLADLYTKFTSNYNARSGSAEAVERMILDLYRSAKAINAENSVAEVTTIANAICTSISPNTGVRVVINSTDPDPEKWTGALANLQDAKFPSGVLSLPMGAAQLRWDDTNKQFIYNDNPYYAEGGTTTLEANTALNKYCYPAELLYFDNSPLRSTDSYKKVSDYPTSVALWDAELGTTGGFDGTWTGDKVQATTRAVAMRNNVNYGVSLLESYVQLNTTSLKDNQTTILNSPTDVDQTIVLGEEYTVGEDTKTRAITLKGILVGGQPGTVNWQMLPASTAFDHVIYDKELDATSTWDLTTTSPSDKVYTVVFDNYTTATSQNDVLVALEFVNNTGKDFYGVNGLIPAGHTFYLVGLLDHDPTHTATTDTWLNDYPANYRIPQAGTRRVFGQDHKAIARFYIGGESLKKAYSTIPDLRSTEVLFGLSVDLQWKNGMTFDVNL